MNPNATSTGTNRRKWLRAGITALAGTTGALAAARLARQYGLIPPDATGPYALGTSLTYATHRLLTRHSLAREFPRTQISKAPFANGKPPELDAYKRLQADDFKHWKLAVEGLVERPRAFSVEELKSMTSSSQITQVTCEEGWSYVAEWIGVPLRAVLESAGIRPNATHVVYFSIEQDWWDSLDMADALHPQTLVAHGFNGGELTAPFGGPLRMRVPRQLAYKSVKYLNRLVVTDNIRAFGKGLGSASPEGGYSWYAGM